MEGNLSGRMKKLLFVCTINRMRSATAHTIFEDDERFEAVIKKELI
tara:strand:- start:216 stop:353 length:138 start_codon:yes stop_codon:yes gene_type:complete